MNTLAFLAVGAVGLTLTAATAKEVCWAEDGHPVTSVVTDDAGGLLYGTSDLANCENPKQGHAVCTDEAGRETPVYFTISGDTAVLDYFGSGPVVHRKIACN